MVILDNISVTFNAGSAQALKALDHINLQIKKGKFLVLIGSNGSGKSTLLNILAGTVKPDEGYITIEEQDVTAWPAHRRSKLVSRVFQDPMRGTASELSIIENFRLAALRTGARKLLIGANNKFIEQVKAHVSTLGLGLEDKLQLPIGGLSGGQRQALTLLMSAMAPSRLLLLDEPVAALDPRTSELIMQLAQEIIAKHALTAVLVTHSMKHACTFGDKLIYLHRGVVNREVEGAAKAGLTPAELYDWFENEITDH